MLDVQPPPTNFASSLLKKAKILVVEDDNHLLSGIREILEIENYRVLTASNGQDGLTVLHSDPNNPPDLIVSDIMMPLLDGFEFLEQVRADDRWVTIPFIFLTALGEREDKFKGRDLGADVYLTKPFDAANLLSAVKSTLKRHQELMRVRQQQTAQAVSDHKRKMITILNHELRTPLTLVVAYSDMLRTFDPNNLSKANANEMVEFLQGVNSGAGRLQRLIENFITVVELDSGDAQKTFNFRKQPITDLTFAVYEAVRQVELAEKRPRNFEIDIPAGLPTIQSDQQYLTIALRELLDNAAKFSADGDNIKLSAHHVDDMLEIHIQDCGRGIIVDELENIWDPFYQIDRDTFEDQGSGSGLAIVDSIVAMHDGERRVVSTPDEGSTFIIRLPIDDNA